jgi:hypothetical protein
MHTLVRPRAKTMTGVVLVMDSVFWLWLWVARYPLRCYTAMVSNSGIAARRPHE